MRIYLTETPGINCGYLYAKNMSMLETQHVLGLVGTMAFLEQLSRPGMTNSRMVPCPQPKKNIFMPDKQD